MIDNLDRKYFKLAVGANIGKETDVDISAKCPICGDSKIHHNEKRLHLYEKNGVTLVHCFNGDCRVTPQSMGRFLKFFYPDLYNSYKREKNISNLESLKNESFNKTLNDTSINDIFKSVKKERKEKYPSLSICNFQKYFINAKESKICQEYLKSRGFILDDFKDIGDVFYSEVNMKIGERFYYLKNSIVIPLYIPNKDNKDMYGFYSRHLTEKEFFTYLPEYNQGYKIWNYFNIDKEQPVYIFEGIFDAMAAYKAGLKNVIACLGAKLPQERIDELKDPVFCLDNDKTGLLNMLGYCKKYKVCVYPDVRQKDTNEMMLNNINVRDLILNNTYKGLIAEVKIRKKL